MRDDHDIAAAFNEGLEPVVAETPPIPGWEALQFESEARASGSGQWWLTLAAAAVVVMVGVGSLLWAGRIGGTDEDSGAGNLGGSDVTTPAAELASIEGRWVLESWEDGEDQIEVEAGVNTVGEPWIEFTADFEGERDSFISADSTGTAGIVTGSTGCNSFGGAYEYSGGFVMLQRIEVNAAGCEPNTAEQVMVAILQLTSDGIDIIMGPDRMEWFGSNLEGRTYPLTFRRDGVPAPGRPAAPSSTTTLAPEEGLAVRVYEVDGIEVVTPSLLAELPERASQVEFRTTVVDSGNRPTLCLWSQTDGIPPQCSGPAAIGLDMDGWSEEGGGVRWGLRSVTVNWPPVGTILEVVDQSEYVPWGFADPSQALPAECAGIALEAGARPVRDYARSLGEAHGGLFIANEGPLVLEVVGDPAPHREALAELGGACVVEVPRSENEQRNIAAALNPRLDGIPELLGTWGSSPGAGGRLNLWVPVADRETAQAIAALVDDPAAIRIIGMGILHA